MTSRPELADESLPTSDSVFEDSIDASQPATQPGTSKSAFSLTSEQREKIKQQLLERQRAARSGSNEKKNSTAHQQPTDTPFPQSSPEPKTIIPASRRDYLVAQAVTFLRSPNVKDTSKERKIAFLKQKGLSEEEIDHAFSLVGDKEQNISADAVPFSVTAVPSMNVASHNTNLTPPIQQAYPAPLVQSSAQPSSRKEAWKNLLLALLLSGGLMVGVVSLIKRHFLPSLMRFKRLYDIHLEKQQEMVTGFMRKVAGLGQLFSFEPNTSDGRSASMNTLPSVIRTAFEQTNVKLEEATRELQRHHTHVQKQIVDGNQDAGNSSLRRLRQATEDLTHLVSQETYFSPSMYTFYSSINKSGAIPNGVSEASANWMKSVAEVKSDIRTLKGMLLNRRNFPTVNGH